MNSEPKKRGRAVSNRREEILQVAAALFASRGFEAASIRVIGDAAGILPGSLYHHFASKEEMLQDLLKRCVNKLVPLYESVLAGSADVTETLSNLITAGLNVSLQNSSELTVIMHERKFLNRNPEFSYVNEVMLEVERIWFGVLQEGVRSGAFRKDLDMNLVLRMIMDLISSTIIWYNPKSRYTQEQIVNNQIKLLFNGLKD